MTQIRKIPKYLACLAIRTYQGWSKDRNLRCRFIPTCSVYAEEAIDSHGLIKGSYYSLKRILKCRPWGSFGYDPPPLKTHSAAGKSGVGKLGAGKTEAGKNCRHLPQSLPRPDLVQEPA